MERKVAFAPGEFYHLYNRGTDKRDIFVDQKDWRRFARSLYVANSPDSFRLAPDTTPLENIQRKETLVDIGAWCLMPNHFHLLVREKEDGGISRFMLKLTTSYSMYFNKRHERSGRLFQGPFQSSYVDNDRYLEYLFAYINLNPVKLIEPEWKDSGILDHARATRFLDTYRFSSYDAHLERKSEYDLILNKDAFPEYFVKPRDFQDYLNDWLTYIP